MPYDARNTAPQGASADTQLSPACCVSAERAFFEGAKSAKPALATPAHIKAKIFAAIEQDTRERMQDDPDGHPIPKIPVRVCQLVEDAIKAANDEAEAGYAEV